MSIIYEALKKIEQSKPKPQGKANNKDLKGTFATKEIKKNKNVYLIYVIVAFAGFFLAKFVFDAFINAGLAKTPAVPLKDNLIKAPKKNIIYELPVNVESPPGQSQEKPLPSLLLSGIFSDAEVSYAIINDKIVKEGESIEGARLVNILSNEVALDFEGKPIRLKINY